MILDKYTDGDDLAINGEHDLRKFIQANYQRMTIFQMCEMLNVSPAFIQESLTTPQLKRAGRKAAASVLILRDIDNWEEDRAQWQS